MSIDRLYQVDTVPEDFDFNEHVVEVFDDMLDRSIPFYHEVIKAAARLLEQHLQPGDTICDLGCATGTALLACARLLKTGRFKFIGLDTSPAMLEKACLKAKLYTDYGDVSFRRQDITQLEMVDTGAFIVNFTLQYIRPVQRRELVTRLFNQLRPGGILILSEKTIVADKRLNRDFIDIYHKFKRDKGYSELEIARKREALENILIPFSLEENREMLLKAGFCPVESFFQWFNFSSLAALKPL